VPLRGEGSVIRYIVGFGGGSASSYRRLAEWWYAVGVKKGKQGRRETVSGNGTHCPPPLFRLSPHSRVRTIPRT